MDEKDEESVESDNARENRASGRSDLRPLNGQHARAVDNATNNPYHNTRPIQNPPAPSTFVTKKVVEDCKGHATRHGGLILFLSLLFLGVLFFVKLAIQ